MKEKGLPAIHTYRIPLETEWEYVAQQPISKGTSKNLSTTIQKVYDGASDEWGLLHFSNNVSEWVTPVQEKTGVVRGGSWKSENGISARQAIDPNSQEAYIGFRIVQSYKTVQK